MKALRTGLSDKMKFLSILKNKKFKEADKKIIKKI